MKTVVLAAAALMGGALALAAADHRAAAAAEPKPAAKVQTGIASVYARKFANRRTASGQRMNLHALSAAHRTLPFGTKVRVHNKRNGRAVVVHINDRGPFVRGRVIDLSPAAASSLGFSGLAAVSLEVLAQR